MNVLAGREGGRVHIPRWNRKERIAPLFTSKHFPRPLPATATSGHNRLDFEEEGKVLWNVHIFRTAQDAFNKYGTPQWTVNTGIDIILVFVQGNKEVTNCIIIAIIIHTTVLIATISTSSYQYYTPSVQSILENGSNLGCPNSNDTELIFCCLYFPSTT